MNDDFSFNETELSAEDLAVLDAFDTLESWPTASSPADISPSLPIHTSQSSSSPAELDDMLTIFLPEVEDDISNMLQALKQLEQEGYRVPTHFRALQRLGHKLRGTSGAVGYPKMSEIASHIELIAEQVVHNMLQPAMGGKAIAYTITVLEFYLYSLVQDGYEPTDEIQITNLQNFYARSSINLDQPIPVDDPILPAPTPAAAEVRSLSADIASSSALSPSSSIHVGTHQFDNLIDYTEKLFEQHTSIENAYKQLETIFQDLHMAQARFQHLETLFSTSVTQEHLPQLLEGPTSSSLITRILNTGPSHDSSSHTHKNKVNKTHTKFQQTSEWDELDIEHYSEKDMLLRSLREAMSNIDVTSTRLNNAYRTLLTLQQKYMTNITLIRNETLSMRQAPLSTIMPQLRDVVMTSMFAKEQQVDFEVTNDSIELDQDVLLRLYALLVQMLQTCIANVTATKERGQSYRIWLSAHSIGCPHTVSNDLSLEIGFSMAVHGGAVQTLREQIRLLNGSLSLERNTEGGISFFLRFPRMRGTIPCLLVRVANQQLLVPLSHVHHVGHISQDTAPAPYYLGSLLNIPTTTTEYASVQPILFLDTPVDQEPLSIQVDEIIDQTELVVKPLKSHLQRPGITGAAVDGSGNVLLLLDIAELIRLSKQRITRQGISVEISTKNLHARPLKILVADDSANIRHSVLQTLEHAPCEVLEARDGLETLELLKSNTPDILLLDIEMPYLNGYDILDIVRHNSQLSMVKIIILTSRTSGKHRQHALELGAHAYLTKPSPQKLLLSTIEKLLPYNALAFSS